MVKFRTCFLFVYIWPYKPYKQVGPGEHWRSQRGARCPPWLLLEFFRNSRLDFKVVTIWHGGKKIWKKKDFYLVESDQTIAFVLSYCNLHLFHYFFILFYIIIYTIFTIYDTFHSILFLNDVRDITNFTTYVLQICMSPITKNNF